MECNDFIQMSYFQMQSIKITNKALLDVYYIIIYHYIIILTFSFLPIPFYILFRTNLTSDTLLMDTVSYTDILSCVYCTRSSAGRICIMQTRSSTFTNMPAALLSQWEPISPWYSPSLSLAHH